MSPALSNTSCVLQLKAPYVCMLAIVTHRSPPLLHWSSWEANIIKEKITHLYILAVKFTHWQFTIFLKIFANAAYWAFIVACTALEASSRATTILPVHLLQLIVATRQRAFYFNCMRFKFDWTIGIESQNFDLPLSCLHGLSRHPELI